MPVIHCRLTIPNVCSASFLPHKTLERVNIMEAFDSAVALGDVHWVLVGFLRCKWLRSFSHRH